MQLVALLILKNLDNAVLLLAGLLKSVADESIGSRDAARFGQATRILMLLGELNTVERLIRVRLVQPLLESVRLQGPY